ncbi:multidrug efflux pump subunit AcrA (membrane-fusion protein) [Novosphingobium sp. SG751A]|uniref:hypothetical protein n=1 Tax=Novosphingobium sp. SG751A TaxID=2587000 RepID=UPI001552466F|nr:hypothetical protein [Novosphingobium sp. SG751A]NOW48977.1 multidrug efflux pump subunit AcrA (membrane-fusion protein) [Novosphingobium sp. SG751A]
MRAQRLAIAQTVAERLFAAETALDIALARIAELNAALPLARLDGGISAIVGQEAILSSASAMMLVAETREKIVATHANLKQASDDIGLREASYGDLVKPGKVAPLDVGQHLRVA